MTESLPDKGSDPVEAAGEGQTPFRTGANVASLPADDVQILRDRHYNASVVSLRRIHADLMIVRVRPDCGVPEFQAGQYTVLGLGDWEPRITNVQPETPATKPPDLIKRAYSMSCSLLDDGGRLVRAADAAYLEFYIALVRRAADRPPALTPRLFGLEVGDRLYCGRRAFGNYTLAHVQRTDAVVLLATGTGEAPHNAMVVDLLAAQHRGRIVVATCVRYRHDLGYLDVHRRLQERFANYQYLPLTTREPENTDPAHPDYVGKRYLQDLFSRGDFVRQTGLDPARDRLHVFLCGNPAMIGAPRHTHDPAQRYPQPNGMVELLEQRGLHVDQPHEPGNIHLEKYW